MLLPREKTTVAKSFRINEEALEALREEARSQNLSLNTLVNQLLVNYSQFGRFMRRMHVMMLSRQTVNELIKPLSDEDAIKAGQNTGKTAPAALMTAIDGKITVSHVIKLIHNLSSYGNLFEYTEKNEGGHCTITLMHEMGRKWSLIIAHYINAAFAAAQCQAKYDIADRYVTFTI
jgi:hypothetical protein